MKIIQKWPEADLYVILW